MTATSSETRGVGPVAHVALGAVQPARGARLEPGFHAELAALNREVTIPHGIRMLEVAGNLRNLRRLTADHDGPFEGMRFADSDVYKTLEAVAWELGRAHSDELRAFYDDTVDLLIRAQRDDGYLDSAYQLGEPFGEPWSDFAHGHELYCLGHLVQAAVAGKRATGDDRLLGVAERFVTLAVALFGGEGSPVYCGHPEVETALIELHRLTGDASALELAEAFLRRRGSGFVAHGAFGAQYYQDEVGIADTGIMRGHAVRALYLNAGVADLVLERGDTALRSSLERQWADLVAHRLYITGGTGSRHKDEAFGDGYELPSDRAYAETCAGIALMNWAWRMHLVGGEAAYLDIMERCFYNVVLAGISRSGDRFFYSNPLQLRGDHGASQEESAGVRLEWYSCACCPPNLMRTIATLESTFFSRSGAEVRVAHFGSAALPLGDGATLTMRSAYPADGRVVLAVHGDPGESTLVVRVPAWAGERVAVRSSGVELAAQIDDGWLRLGRLDPGATFEIDFAMDAVLWRPNPGIDALRGTVAASRGPLVYCADQVDNTLDIERVVIPDGARIAERRPAEGGPGPLLHVEVGELDPAPGDRALYERADSPQRVPRAAAQDLVLRPYATWGNGAVPGAMKVWLPTR